MCTNRAQQDNPSVTRYVTAGGKVHYIAVWVDKRNHPRASRATSTGATSPPATGSRWPAAPRSSGIPEIDDNWVLWVEADDAAGPYRIRAHDRNAGKTYTVATTSVLSPVSVDSRTVGSRTVHTAVYTSGKGNIGGRNLPDGDPFIVSQRSTFEWMPDISNNRVVWWETGGRIMLRNLKTDKRSSCTPARGRASTASWSRGTAAATAGSSSSPT